MTSSRKGNSLAARLGHRIGAAQLRMGPALAETVYAPIVGGHLRTPATTYRQRQERLDFLERDLNRSDVDPYAAAAVAIILLRRAVRAAERGKMPCLVF